MSEVEKMYENANIKICKRKQGFTLKDCTDRDCKECGYYVMPPFTAEKQIAILCWLVNLTGDVEFNNKPTDITPERLQEALAWAVNRCWAKLTPEQQQQIKEILK